MTQLNAALCWKLTAVKERRRARDGHGSWQEHRAVRLSHLPPDACTVSVGRLDVSKYILRIRSRNHRPRLSKCRCHHGSEAGYVMPRTTAACSYCMTARHNASRIRSVTATECDDCVNTEQHHLAQPSSNVQACVLRRSD